MNSLQRTLAFLKNETTDRIPFQPILMRWAAQYCGLDYRDFCLDPKAHCDANIKCAEDFASDWVNVMSDPYAEAEAFGLKLEYPPNNLPVETIPLLETPEDAATLQKPEIDCHQRLQDRISEIEYFKRNLGNRTLITGWVEGPLAEYSDLRGLAGACMDFFDNPSQMEKALDVITDFAAEFAAAQVRAGAHCIGIGDAACSQIGPQLYTSFIWEREKRMVDEIHSMGALVKLHICGDTTPILKEMISTGADIVDVDHLVQDMGGFTEYLMPGQVFSGKSDPVSIIQNGSKEDVRNSVATSRRETGERCIVSAGCEITPETSVDNLRILSEASR